MIQEERPEVRLFAVADWATVPPDGKMYIGGLGVGQVYVNTFPSALPPLFLVCRIRIPWHLTTAPTPFVVRVLDADRNTVGPDPLIQSEVETGRPAGTRPGDEFTLQFALPLMGYPIQSAATLYFHLEYNGQELAVLPLKVGPAQMPLVIQGPPAQ
jgi:hypothetical protein